MVNSQKNKNKKKNRSHDKTYTSVAKSSLLVLCSCWGCVSSVFQPQVFIFTRMTFTCDNWCFPSTQCWCCSMFSLPTHQIWQLWQCTSHSDALPIGSVLHINGSSVKFCNKTYPASFQNKVCWQMVHMLWHLLCYWRGAMVNAWSGLIQT